MTKHTSGPLTIHGPSPGGTPCDDGGDYAIRDAEGYIIGEAICYTDRSYIPHPAKENAQLWAIAPSMYKTLEKIANGSVSMDKTVLLIQMEAIKEMAQVVIGIVAEEEDE